MTGNQIDIETVQTRLEKIMLELPRQKSKAQHRMYLAGVIDTYLDLGSISHETHKILYATFCF